MKRLALAVALMAGPASAETCADAWAAVKTVPALPFAIGGSVLAEGDWCVVRDLHLDLPGQYVPDWRAAELRFRGAAVAWLLDRSLPPERLEVEVSGLHFFPQMDNPQWNYMMEAQSRANTIAVSAAVSWSAADRELLVERFEIDFRRDNRISLTARVGGVDLSSPGAMQMSSTGFAVREADLIVQSHGLFEAYLLMVVAPLVLPSEGDMEAAAEKMRRDAIAAVADLPAATFNDASKAALSALIGELPNPAGTFTWSLRSEAGFGPARVIGFAMTGVPKTIAEAAPLFEGVTIDIGWTHQDAP